MDRVRPKQQTKLQHLNSWSSLSIYRKLYWARPSNAYNNSKNKYHPKCHRHNFNLQSVAKKLLLLSLGLITCTPSYAADVGGVSATANPIANSSGSVTNQAIQVLQGPYITNTYGGGIQCQGATMNVTPFVTGTGAFKRPFERYYDDPVYDIHDADDDGQIDNPGNVLYYVPTRTNQTENYNLSLGVSATWSKPLDKELQAQCKEAAATQINLLRQLTANKRLDFEIARLKNCGELKKAGIVFHPKSPYASVCADVIVTNPGGKITPHSHTLPQPDFKDPSSDSSSDPSSQTSTSLSQLSSPPSSSSDVPSQNLSQEVPSSHDTHSSSAPSESDDKGFFRGWRLPWSSPALSPASQLEEEDQPAALLGGPMTLQHSLSPQSSSQPVD